MIVKYNFAQSKKELIILLNNKIDSLVLVINNQRTEHLNINIYNKNIINEKNSKIQLLTNNVNILRDSVKLINNTKNKIIIGLNNKIDSLNKTLADKLKSNSYYEEIKIGNQTWMSNNLDVVSFNNGDKILEAKNEFEWNKAQETGQPAYKTIECEKTSQQKHLKVYNIHAIEDHRQIVPKGWRIAYTKDWIELAKNFGTPDVFNEWNIVMDDNLSDSIIKKLNIETECINFTEIISYWTPEFGLMRDAIGGGIIDYNNLMCTFVYISTSSIGMAQGSAGGGHLIRCIKE